MESNTIEQGNKLIHIWLGKSYETDRKIVDLKYHSSWDWLMPVVEKIKGLKFGISVDLSFDNGLSVVSVYDYDNEFQMCQCRYGTKEKSPIETAWLCIIQFIEWFNKAEK